MASQRSWGSSFRDFKVREGQKRPATQAAAAPRKKKRTTPKALPTLAPELDELHNFVETLAAEEVIKDPDISFDTEGPQQDTDSDLSEPDDDTPNGLQMDPEVITKLIAEVEGAHNSEPEENACRLIPVSPLLLDKHINDFAVPDDMPEAIAENIRRHDY